MWYLLAVVDVMLMLFAPAIAGLGKIGILPVLSNTFWLGFAAIAVFLYALNLFQICYLPNAYPEDCERLYQELIHGKTANKG